jgi:hypothetical protein
MSVRHALARLASFAASCLIVTLVLYPVLWGQPLAALGRMWSARQELVAAQVAATQAAMPWAVLSGPGERLATLLAQLYFAPPQFAEAANYLSHTAAAEGAYLANPLHTVLRGIWGGALLMGLSLLGVVFGIRDARRSTSGARRYTGVGLLATALQGAALVVAVPLAFQRYVIPMVPLVCLWCGVGAASLVEVVARNRRPMQAPAEEK